MNGEPPTQFDGLYKICKLFRSVLEFNEPPSQFPLREHDHFFRDYAPATSRK